jgi:polyhydroxyalkanoate synthesis regulator phasin
MAEPDSRSAVEKLLLGLLEGARADETRARLDELASRWRGDAVRLRERAGYSIEKLAQDLGLVTRRDFDELELRLAQLEHRVNLLEAEPPSPRDTS